MPCSRDVRSFVVETKRTLSPAGAVSAAESDQPKLPLSKPLPSKPLLTEPAAASAPLVGPAPRPPRAGSRAAPRPEPAPRRAAPRAAEAVSRRASCATVFSIVLPVGTGALGDGSRRVDGPGCSGFDGSCFDGPGFDRRRFERGGRGRFGLGLGPLARGHGHGERQRLIERQRRVERQLARRHALDERADDGAGGNRRLGADDDADGAACARPSAASPTGTGCPARRS